MIKQDEFVAWTEKEAGKRATYLDFSVEGGHFSDPITFLAYMAFLGGWIGCQDQMLEKLREVTDA